MHAIGIPYFQEFSPIKDLMEAIPLCDIIQSYTNIHVYTQLFLLLMQLYFVLGDMFRLSQCSRVAIYTRIGKHTTQRHGVIHLTRIIISTKTPLPPQQQRNTGPNKKKNIILTIKISQDSEPVFLEPDQT